MSSRTITKQRTGSSSNVNQIDQLELQDVIEINRAKNIADWNAKLGERKSESALSLGAVAWEQMFDSDNLELPDKKDPL